MISQSSLGWLRAPVIAFPVAVALSALLYRQGRLLTFDGYHYCESAKLYAHSWPSAFGNHWPCGYPLLGGLLGRLGLPAYQALSLLSLLALAILVLLANRCLANLPNRSLALTALAATPMVGVQLFGNLAELPFATALLGLATVLAAWQKPSAWWMAAGCALLALSIRYAGVIAYAALWAWLVIHARSLRENRALGAAGIAVVSSTLAAVGLLLWNLHATGYLSGVSFGAAESVGFAAWPRHLADFGWSPASALMLGRLRELAGGDETAGQLAGVLFSLGGGGLCLWAWIRPHFPWVRALAFIAFAYGAGMTILRSVGRFDSLSSGRMFLPELFPLGLVAIAQFSGRWPRLVASACALLLAIGAGSAVRGLSREIAGDVHAAVPLLRAQLRATDGVQINDDAFSLAAYLPQRTYRTWPESWRDERAQRFLVVAAASVDRRGTPGRLPPAWQDLAAQLVTRGTHRRLLDSPSLLGLERTTGPLPR